ncbi:MAG TPA: UxaA family hydrolase, partial [Chitinophagaceae bacterium]
MGKLKIIPIAIGTNFQMDNIVIQTTPQDNVGIVANSSGLKKGVVVLTGIVLLEDIPMGHKVALTSVEKDDAIIRYGQPIGYAKNSIAKGSWINESNMNLPQPPDLNEIPYIKKTPPAIEPLKGYTFQGYKNADGSAGTKNVLGITTSVQCVAGITDFICQKIKKELLPLYPNVDDIVVFNHSYGCGI